MSFHAVVDIKLLVTTVAEKVIATVLPNLVLLSVGKDLKTMSNKLQEQTPSLSFALYLNASPALSSSQS